MFITTPLALQFITEQSDPGGEQPTDPPAEQPIGFPADTPTENMTADEKAAYWRNQAKVQQRARDESERKVRAYAKFGTVEELQQSVDAAEQARLAALDDNTRAVESARAEGRQEGAAQNATRHLAAAVTGLLIAHTKSAAESYEDAEKRVTGAIEFADLTKFVDEAGELDAEKVRTFASSIGSTDSDSSTPDDYGLFRVMQRQTLPDPKATGSVAAMEQEHYERLTKNRK